MKPESPYPALLGQLAALNGSSAPYGSAKQDKRLADLERSLRAFYADRQHSPEEIEELVRMDIGDQDYWDRKSAPGMPRPKKEMVLLR